MELSLIEGVALLLGFFKMGEAVCEWIMKLLGGGKNGGNSKDNPKASTSVSFGS